MTGSESFMQAVRAATRPDVIVTASSGRHLEPASSGDLSACLRLAREHGVAIDAPGSVRRPSAVRLSLGRLTRVLGVDRHSLVVQTESGITLARLDEEIRAHDLTLGLVDAPLQMSVCEWIALGAPGGRKTADDPIDHMIAGIGAILPDGRELNLRPAPRRAAGPDLLGATTGARNRLGILVSVHLVARYAVASTPLAFFFDAAPTAERALAWMRGRGVRLAASTIVATPTGQVLLLALGGAGALRDASAQVARAVSVDHNGVEIDANEAPRWPIANATPPGPLIDELAERLDPDHILG